MKPSPQPSAKPVEAVVPSRSRTQSAGKALDVPWKRTSPTFLVPVNSLVLVLVLLLFSCLILFVALPLLLLSLSHAFATDTPRPSFGIFICVPKILCSRGVPDYAIDPGNRTMQRESARARVYHLHNCTHTAADLLSLGDPGGISVVIS